MIKIGVIIVAGGSGTRMGTETPKQFLEINGRPLLMHTIDRFYAALPQATCVVALPQSQIVHWFSLCEQQGFTTDHTVVAGGETRFHSVQNALEEMADCDYIGVHDGVRPLVTGELIRRVLDTAQEYGGAIPVVDVLDSLREMIFCEGCAEPGREIGSRIVDRTPFRAVQTPQFFKREMLFKAYEQEYAPAFTDDASVVERAGYTVTLVKGDYRNIKVTTPTDLVIAGALLAQ